MFVSSGRVTVNWELATPIRESRVLLGELARDEVYRVHFSAGDVLMYDDLHELVRTTVALGMRASVTSSGSRMTPRFLQSTAPLLSQIGLSYDYVESNRRLGRVQLASDDLVCHVFRRLDLYAPHCQRTMHTSVMRTNLHRDFAPFLADCGVHTWKVARKGVTESEFAEFLRRNADATPEHD